MPNVVNCPSCERPLQVPPELHGRPLRCPACGQVFLLPPQQESLPDADAATEQKPPTGVPAAPDEEAVEAQLVDGDEAQDGLPEGEQESEVRTEDLVRQRVFGPAIMLVVIGTLGLALSLYLVSRCLRGDPPDPSDVDWLPEDSKQMMRQLAAGPFFVIWGSTLAALNFVSLLAARQMLYLRYWHFAVIGSILAIINGALNWCCVAGIVIGIWALLVLYHPTVRRTFE